MNGWQVLDIILGKPEWRDIPVFIVTGAGNDEFKEQAEDLGITYIEKPFNINLLEEKIEQLFNKK